MSEPIMHGTEDHAKDMYQGPLSITEAIQLSIAISLKRIADATEQFILEFRNFNQE